MALTPTQFHLHEAERTLDVSWSDGHTFTFALEYLRGWCPCAKCQGHFSGGKTFIRDVSTKLVDLEPVGAYAVRPLWGDGHQSGMYAFEYLLELEQGPPDQGPSNDEFMPGASS